jgi:hypothetical protein
MSTKKATIHPLHPIILDKPPEYAYLGFFMYPSVEFMEALDDDLKSVIKHIRHRFPLWPCSWTYLHLSASPIIKLCRGDHHTHTHNTPAGLSAKKKKKKKWNKTFAYRQNI